jgi:hypothetical protein
MSPEQIIEKWVAVARAAAVRGFIFPEHRRTARR